jgi:Mg2+-importing ATPase
MASKCINTSFPFSSALSAILLALFAIFGLFILKTSIPAFQTGWFLESIISQMFIIFSIRTYMVPFFKSKISLIFTSGILTIILFVLWLPFSFLGPYLHLVSLPSEYFIFLIIIVFSYFSIIEITKFYFYRPKLNQIKRAVSQKIGQN